MLKLITYILLLILVFACSEGQKESLVDIILVNAKGKIHVGDEYYKQTDSVRVGVTELTELSVYAKGFQIYDAQLFPGCQLTDEKGIGKIYITLRSSKFYQIERKKNERYLRVVAGDLSATALNSFVFESLEEFNEIADKTVNDLRFDDHKNRYVKAALTDFTIRDFIESNLSLTKYEFDGLYATPASSLKVRFVINDSRMICVEGVGMSFQVSGQWDLLTNYNEVLYSHRFRHYESMGEFKADDNHGKRVFANLFEANGISFAISEAMVTGFIDFMQSTKVKQYLKNKTPLFTDTRNYNKSLPLMHLKSNVNGTKLEDVVNSTVLISNENESEFGSGSMISCDGYILTDYHVVAGMDEIFVKLNSGEKKVARLVRSDRELDVALLKINGKDCPTVQLAPDYQLQLGEHIHHVGTPGNVRHFSSVFEGIVSGTRKIDDNSYIQTNAICLGGMSGGPLVNSKRRQIGMVVWVLQQQDRNGYQQYFSYSVSIRDVLESLNIAVN